MTNVSIVRWKWQWGYLQGVAETLVPLNGSPEAKIQVLLTRLHRLLPRLQPQPLTDKRDPILWFRYGRFLRDCGAAAGVFVHLARTLGVPARCLLLLNESGQTKHVTAEVWLNGRWVVADPLLGTLIRDGNGQLLSKEQLRNPKVFRTAMQGTNYPPEYTFERYGYINWNKVPLIGKQLGEWMRRTGLEGKIGRPLFLDNDRLKAIYLWAANAIFAGVLLLVSLRAGKRTKKSLAV